MYLAPHRSWSVSLRPYMRQVLIAAQIVAAGCGVTKFGSPAETSFNAPSDDAGTIVVPPEPVVVADAEPADAGPPHDAPDDGGPQTDAGQSDAGQSTEVIDVTPPPVDSDGDGVPDIADGCDARVYGKTIVVDDSFTAPLISIVENELAARLRDTTGQPAFTVVRRSAFAGPCATEQTAISIHLANSSSAATLAAMAPAQVLQKLPTLALEPKEAYILSASSNRALWMVGNSDRAIRHAIHDYLDRLGYRWLLPNPRWTVTPRRADIRVVVDRIQTPAIRSMGFIGTGSWGANAGIPNYGRVRAAWTDWTVQNRWTYEINPGGHTGEAFNRERHAQLSADPLMMAEVNGSRWMLPDAGVYNGIKPHATYHGGTACSSPGAVVSYTSDAGRTHCEDPNDYSTYGGVIAVFVDWVLGKLARLISRDANGPSSRAISVSPADGQLYCTCWKCRDLLRKGPYLPRVDRDSTVSDRVFHMANEAAKRIAVNYPGRIASLQAYDAYTMPPTIPLEPNLSVMIVAYGIQRTGLTGDELIAAWARKSTQNPRGEVRLGVYDYWCVPDWDLNLPTCGTKVETEKLVGWGNAGIKDVALESSYSAGAVGLSLYAWAKWAWGAHGTSDPVVDDFMSNAFGSARAPMDRMFGRWGSEYLHTKHELGLSFRDLDEAARLAAQAQDSAAMARIDDLTFYVQYLRLLFEFKNAADAAAKESAADAMIRHIWRGFDSVFVHSFRIHRLILSKRELPPSFWAKWNLANAQASGWNAASSMTPITASEVAGWRAGGIASLVPLAFTTMPYSNNLVPLGQTPAADSAILSPTFKYSHTFEFVAAAPRTLALTVTTEGQVGCPAQRMTVSDPVGAIVYDERFNCTTDTWTSVAANIPLARSGKYRLKYSVPDPGSSFRLSIPQDLPFVVLAPYRNRTRIPGLLQYFYVPAGIDRVVVAVENVTPTDTRFYAPGNIATPVAHTTFGPNLMVVETNGRAGVWAFKGIVSAGNTAIKFLNVPNVISFSPAQMMVPDNVTP